MVQVKRQPAAVWRVTRRRVWKRDRGRCQGPYCRELPDWSLSLRSAHIDHIQELSQAGRNHVGNLRTLCRRCHCLRSSHAHRAIVIEALIDGVIPLNWREWMWSDGSDNVAQSIHQNNFKFTKAEWPNFRGDRLLPKS